MFNDCLVWCNNCKNVFKESELYTNEETNEECCPFCGSSDIEEYD